MNDIRRVYVLVVEGPDGSAPLVTEVGAGAPAHLAAEDRALFAEAAANSLLATSEGENWSWRDDGAAGLWVERDSERRAWFRSVVVGRTGVGVPTEIRVRSRALDEARKK